MANLWGTQGDDLLYGTRSADRMVTSGGVDTVGAGLGNDRVYGGEGNDGLYGEAGNDIVEGGFGNDWLFGGLGNDTVRGGAGDDYIVGDAGNDTLNGGDGNDYLIDREGTNRMFGEAGDDVLDGWGANSLLSGGAGDDYLLGGGRQYGREGNDTLVSYSNAAPLRMEGGEGADTFTILFAIQDGTAGNTRVVDFDAAGGDRLRLQISVPYVDEHPFPRDVFDSFDTDRNGVITFDGRDNGCYTAQDGGSVMQCLEDALRLNVDQLALSDFVL